MALQRRVLVLALALLLLFGFGPPISALASVGRRSPIGISSSTFNNKRSVTSNRLRHGRSSSDNFQSKSSLSQADQLVLRLESGFPLLEPVNPSSDTDIDSDKDALWLKDRQYGVVIDAGSSGSRVLIYSWKHPLLGNDAGGNGLPVIEKADRLGIKWFKSVEPGNAFVFLQKVIPHCSLSHLFEGLSSLATNVTFSAVRDYLKPLLDFASSAIPANARIVQGGSTANLIPIYLLATAGMRLIPSAKAAQILEYACDTVRDEYPFLSLAGGCLRQFRVISGVAEGIFGWISSNYLMDSLKPHSKDLALGTGTYGFMDMGGGSAQIAFEPGPEDVNSPEVAAGLVSVKLRTLDGSNLDFNVFSTTYLGFGVNEARRRYLEQLFLSGGSANAKADDSGNWRQGGDDSLRRNDNANVSLKDPCLPAGLVLDEPNLSKVAESPVQLTGTGSFSACLSRQYPLLNKTLPCDLDPCPINGVHVPLVDTSRHAFLGVSEFYFTPESLFGLGGVWKYQQIKNAAEKYCGTNWSDILIDYKDKVDPTLRGPRDDYFNRGDIEEDDDVWLYGWDSEVGLVDDQPGSEQGIAIDDNDQTNPGVTKRDSSKREAPRIDSHRLQLQCFKTAWLLNVLHEGFGLPKSAGIDDSTNTTQTAPFRTLNEFRGFPISWTLGAMLFISTYTGTVPIKFHDTPHHSLARQRWWRQWTNSYSSGRRRQASNPVRNASEYMSGLWTWFGGRSSRRGFDRGNLVSVSDLFASTSESSGLTMGDEELGEDNYNNSFGGWRARREYGGGGGSGRSLLGNDDGIVLSEIDMGGRSARGSRGGSYLPQ
ncbi:Golgi apyrase [Blyttiomyces sp. JEL0837]|nr:Golgi apyrase [Blyttiomyces sp. JEL0837]